jgi:hypothetical protein
MLLGGSSRITRSYPKTRIARLSDLTEDQPIDFQYPLQEHNNLLVKLGKRALLGVGQQNYIVAPRIGGRIQPLHAFYSRACLTTAEQLLDDGTTSLMALLSRCRVREVPESDLLDFDPALQSFRDLDTAADYQIAVEAWPNR